MTKLILEKIEIESSFALLIESGIDIYMNKNLRHSEKITEIEFSIVPVDSLVVGNIIRRHYTAQEKNADLNLYEVESVTPYIKCSLFYNFE